MKLSKNMLEMLTTAGRGPIELNGFGFGRAKWAVFGLERLGCLSREGNLFTITTLGRAALAGEKPDA